MAKKGVELAGKLAAAHAAQLGRLVEKKGVKPLVPLYKAVRGDLHDRLRAAGPRGKAATPTVLRTLLSQVDGVLRAFGSDLEDTMGVASRAAAEMGAEGAVDDYKRLAEHFTGTTPVLDLERGALMTGMVDDYEPSLLRRHSLLSQRWSLGAIHAMEDRLSIGMMAGRPLEDMIDDVMGAGGIVDQERWKAERIVRTEAAYAHGAVRFEAMRRTADELGDRGRMMKRLVATFDDRTGDDSYLVHGQMVPIDEPFTWKHKVGGAWVVTSYMHPPNRPNDREVVIPWDPDWEEEDDERPLSISELESAAPTRWRKKTGVEIPPGHVPGESYE